MWRVYVQHDVLRQCSVVGTLVGVTVLVSGRVIIGRGGAKPLSINYGWTMRSQVFKEEANLSSVCELHIGMHRWLHRWHHMSVAGQADHSTAGE